jgi:3-hydroxyisobutyrate dehydrogenase
MGERDAGGTTTARAAVLGLGTMGSAMARRLLGAGFAVAVWDRTGRRAQELAEHGAEAFAEAGEAVAGAGAVVTMLPTFAVTDALVLEGGVIDAMATGAAWAQMGTIGVAGTEQLAASVSSRRPDVSFVDAPVSGTRRPAEEGQLLVLASGPEEARAVLEPLFAAIGRRTLWLGPAGSGTRLKLVLNTWLAFEVEAAAESSALADELGVSKEALREAVDGNPLASGLSLAKLAKIQAGDHTADFALQWALKDLELVEAAVDTERLPAARAIAERWKGLVAAGYGELDVSAAGLGFEAQDGSDR